MAATFTRVRATNRSMERQLGNLFDEAWRRGREVG
jgi:hypothetical protein